MKAVVSIDWECHVNFYREAEIGRTKSRRKNESSNEVREPSRRSGRLKEHSLRHRKEGTPNGSNDEDHSDKEEESDYSKSGMFLECVP